MVSIVAPLLVSIPARVAASEVSARRRHRICRGCPSAWTASRSPRLSAGRRSRACHQDSSLSAGPHPSLFYSRVRAARPYPSVSPSKVVCYAGHQRHAPWLRPAGHSARRAVRVTCIHPRLIATPPFVRPALVCRASRASGHKVAPYTRGHVPRSLARLSTSAPTDSARSVGGSPSSVLSPHQ